MTAFILVLYIFHSNPILRRDITYAAEDILNHPRIHAWEYRASALKKKKTKTTAT
jgi:hypothetical protein